MLESFRDIQRLAGGFQAAKIFLTANDIGLFTEIADKNCAADELAVSLDVDARALGLLLNALTATGLLLKKEGRYRNHPVVYQYLGNPDDYRGSIFRHIHHCWDSWSQLPQIIKTGFPDFAAEQNALGDNDEWTRDFIQGMNDVTRELAPEVVPQLGLENVSVLMDVGGGPGTYAAAFKKNWANISEVRIFDLPEALDIGRKNLQEWGLAERVTFHPGNFDVDVLPGGADAIWLSQVLHSQDEAGCRALIEKACHALNRGGKLMVHEFLLDEEGTSPVMAAIFAIHMLVMTEGGRTYSGSEISNWMISAGFGQVEVEQVSSDTAVVSAVKL